MSGSDERQARSVALEKAYVHDVYEQISNTQHPPTDSIPRGRAWPKVRQFLSGLEPGSLVCDVGCGNGKYLNVNPAVFKIGADRCCTLTETAREKEHEVLMCDNLSLPFRDDTFDAVLSVAVVHHFATTERRVGALRELARVLRIGGRLIISVWAMEQRHRKFESQDVLVPWHRPQHLSTPSLELTSTTNTSEDDLPPPYHAYTQTSDSDSCRSATKTGAGVRKRGRNRHKGRSIDPARPCSGSQSSSSLSSPNETCYSFVRRALQKLAGGKRGGARHRPWFLDSWSSCTKEPPAHRYDPEGCEDGEDEGGEDIHDLPIELRRLEDDHDVPQRRQTFACARQATHHEVILNHKSKSLSDILTVGQRSMVRSRSSVPSLGARLTPNTAISEIKISPTATMSKPRLVKQKKSICEEEVEEEEDDPTDMRDLVKALPEFKISHGGTRRCGGVFKQSSMNEELMSTDRLREKETVRRNIQKQASLNEELIYSGHPKLDSIRDSLFSTSTAKRFQILKNGLTSKLKSSTTGIEKVAGNSFKNGFVRILQGWKGSEMVPDVRPSPLPTPTEPVPPRTPPADSKKTNGYDPAKDTVNPGERRHSREDGSDSSKDSSLQSDTSVDSEDSFASVIYVPKPEPPPDPLLVPTQTSPPKSPLPLSPTVKHHSSLPTSPRMKQPPLSPTSNPMSPTLKHNFSPPKPFPPSMSPKKPASPTITTSLVKTPSPEEPRLELQAAPKTLKEPEQTPGKETTKEDEEILAGGIVEAEVVDKDAEYKHSERLRQIKELLRTRTSSRITGGGSSRSPFPMVRRSTTLTTGKSETQTRPIPRLLSLELFNPETDDMDSDSSGVSSPDSVSSVISVFTEEMHAQIKETTITEPTGTKEPITVKKPAHEHASEETTPKASPVDAVPEICISPKKTTPTQTTPIATTPQDVSIHLQDYKPNKEPITCQLVSERLLEVHEPDEDVDHFSPRVSPSSQSLLEAAADVASSLEDAVETVIQSSPRARRKQLASLQSTDPMAVLGGYSSGGSNWSLQEEWNLNTKTDSISPDSWSSNNSTKTSRRVSPRRRASKNVDENCHQHLTEFAEKLSEKLLEEIDQYRMQTQPPIPPRSSSHNRVLSGLPAGLENHISDPYISRLSEELEDLTKLSADIQERNTYLATLNKETISDMPPTITIESPTTEQLLSPKLNREEMVTIDSVKIELDLANSEVVKDIETWTAALRQSSEDVIEELEALEKVDERDEEMKGDSRFVITPAEDLDLSPIRSELIYRLRRKSQGTLNQDETSSTRTSGSLASLRPGYSLESSDAGDVSSAGKTPSTTSLGPESSDAGSERTGSDCSRDLRFADRRTARCDGRSSSEEAPPRMMLVRQRASIQEPPEQLTKTGSCASSLSGSTSQESLPSDNGGGSITFHRYYHVFKEGELDQLIDKYVENLHIISSYYDHANWCVVAEKVQVWTI